MPRSVPVSLALLTLVTLLAAAPAWSPGAAAQGDLPDLTVTISQTGEVAISPEGKQTVTFRVMTLNSGLGPAGASTTRLHLVPAGTQDLEHAIEIQDQAILGLPPSALHTATAQFTLGPGTFQIIARADAGGVVAEADEGNNLSNTSRVFTVGPDLIVPGLRVLRGGATAEDTTRNSRNATWEAGASTTRFYLSADDVLDAGDTPVGSRAIPALGIGEESTGKTPLRLPPGLTAGTYRVIAVADAGNVRAESNEANNQFPRSALFLPDLIVSSVTVPRKTVAGATISVSATTTNRGTARAPASGTDFYFSRDLVLDAEDLFLGSRAIPPLDIGASSLDLTTVVIPANTPPGCYFIIASADIGHAVEESREANTARARPIQVRPASGAKLPCAHSDFNGDRKSDILWRHSSGDVAPWLMGTLSLGSATIVDASASPPLDWTIAGAGDFDGDGKADILWRHASGLLAIWLMDGTTISRSATIPDGPALDWTIAGVGDFDGDGKADILWRHSFGLLTIWLMDGTTIRRDPTILDGPPLDFTIAGVGDFDGDGKADILWRHSFGLLVIWLMNGTTISSSPTIPDGPALDWTVAGVGDFDGDGKADILWRHSFGLVAIWLMDGTTISSSATIPDGPSPDSTIQGIGDLDGDGNADVLWRDASGVATIWLMDGTTVSSRSATIPDGPSRDWTVQGIGDFDGDGKADILRRQPSGPVVLWLVDTKGISTATIPDRPRLDWTIQGTGDFDGDGNADILWRDASGQFTIWLMDGATISRSVTILDGPALDWTVQGIGDFNGDGMPDILWRHSSGLVAIWLVDGTAISSVVIPASPSLDWTIQGIGDFNGDGKADILWRDASGLLAIWLMDGTVISGSATIPGGPSLDWTIQGIGDFNRDHKADILWRHDFGLLAIWLMDGTTISRSVTIPFGPSLDWTIAGVGDYDGDVNADIMWRDASGAVVIWFMDGASVSRKSDGSPRVLIVGDVGLDWTPE